MDFERTVPRSAGGWHSRRGLGLGLRLAALPDTAAAGVGLNTKVPKEQVGIPTLLLCFLVVQLKLFHRLNAAAANRRVLGALPNISFPMPAAFAFLTVGMGKNKFGR